MSTNFNRKDFEQELHQWLIDNPTQQQRQPLYDFLTAVTLINLITLINKDLNTVWRTDTVKHSFYIYRIPLITATNAATNTNADTNAADAADANTVNVYAAFYAANAYAAYAYAAYAYADVYTATADANAVTYAAVAANGANHNVNISSLWQHAQTGDICVVY